MKKYFSFMVAMLCMGVFVFTSCKKDNDVIQLKVNEIEISVMGHQVIEVAKASGPIVWSSQDILIASVDENGDVFGVSEGTTVVTATVGKASANVQVTVKPGGVTPPSETPTVGDLMNEYDVENNVVLCVFFESEICDDIVIAGSYNEWSTEDIVSMIHMEELEGFDGWYVAEIPYVEGVEAKPVQLQDGAFSWDFQTGDPDSWQYVAGSEATINPGYDGEANVGYPEAGAYIYISKYFKNHKSPCVAAVYHDYTVVLLAPDCGGYEPGLIGDFNGWGASQEMELTASGAYKYTFNDCEGHAFKFRALDDTDWSNQIQLYNAEEDSWYDNPNITLDENTTITLDYSEGRYTLCAEPDSTLVD